MRRIASVLVVLLGITSFACAEGSQPDSDAAEDSASAEESPEPLSSAAQAALEPDAPPELLGLDEALEVDAGANIYGAGRDVPPEPGGGGAGVLPTGWQLPKDAAGGTVTFPRVTGEVTPITGTAPRNGPAGTKAYSTSVNSYRGISGIDHEGRQMFLVGVFLTNAPPKDPPPTTLDFTKPPATDLIAPGIGQVFLIGDGDDYRYKVPRGATRLFLGFADGAFGRGPVGFYGNNAGELRATIALTKD